MHTRCRLSTCKQVLCRYAGGGGEQFAIARERERGKVAANRAGSVCVHVLQVLGKRIRASPSGERRYRASSGSVLPPMCGGSLFLKPG